jgi:hypothetical protein
MNEVNVDYSNVFIANQADHAKLIAFMISNDIPFRTQLSEDEATAIANQAEEFNSSSKEEWESSSWNSSGCEYGEGF